MRHLRIVLAGTIGIAAAANIWAEEPAKLTRIQYRNPGLVVDLGVGLWAWPLPMDFDQDGDFDLVVNCPDKPSNGVYFFENTTGNTSFNKMPVFKPGRRISKGLQNVQVSYVEGKPTVLSPGLEHPDFLISGLDNSRPLPVGPNIHTNRVRANMWRYVDYDGDGIRDLIVGVGDWTDYGWDNAYDENGNWTRGPLRGFVYWLRGTGQPGTQPYGQPVKVLADEKPVEVFGWPSPSFGDFDGDGDLDLICGEFLDKFTYFENVGNRTQPRYVAGRRPVDDSGELVSMDLQMITPTAIDWDRDGDLDLIVGDEDGRVAFVEHTGKLDVRRTPVFRAPRYFQQEAEDLKCGALATPVGFDWDGDGDFDIVSGNTAGYIQIFENRSGPGVELPTWNAPRYLESVGKRIRVMAGSNGSIQGPCEAKWGYTTLSIADWDCDALPDLVVNSIWGKVYWYRNVGTRREPKFGTPAPIEVAWNSPPPQLAYGWLRAEGNALLTQWRTTPVATDFNNDGLVDLVMLDHEGFLAFYERAIVDGQRVLLPPRRAYHGENFSATDQRHIIVDANPGPICLNRGIAGKSGRRKLCTVDWDGDGLLDFFVNSANANYLRQTGSRDGNWMLRDMGLLIDQNIEGHDVSPTTVDFNADGIPDFVGGAEDGKFYYLRNPRSR